MSGALSIMSTGFALASGLLILDGSRDLAQIAALWAILSILWAIHAEMRK